MGHEDKDCHAYEILQERTYESYFVKGEDHRKVQQPQPQPRVVNSHPQP